MKNLSSNLFFLFVISLILHSWSLPVSSKEVERLEDKINTLDQRLEDKTNTLDRRLENKINSMEQNLRNTLDQYLEKRINTINQHLENKINSLEQNLYNLINKYKNPGNSAKKDSDINLSKGTTQDEINILWYEIDKIKIQLEELKLKQNQ